MVKEEVEEMRQYSTAAIRECKVNIRGAKLS